MSMTCGDALPSTLVSESSRPGVFAGMPASMAAWRVLAGPTVLLRLTKAVLIERPIMRRMST